MVDIFIGLGSNLGDRKDFLQRAIEQLAYQFQIERISSVYETEPVGYAHQDWFLNLAAHLRTDRSPRKCAEYLSAIELALKRGPTVPNGPRTIDLDLLFYGDEIIDEPDLVVPHPRLHIRRFVLEPLNELAPDRVHPVLRRTIGELLAGVEDPHEVRKTPIELKLPYAAGAEA